VFTLTTEEVSDLLENHNDERWEYWAWLGKNDTELVDGLGRCRVVDTVGGSEGDGEYMHVVLEVITEDAEVLYFKKTGAYDSWDSNDWDGDLERVTPVEKLVTVYDPISV
jgi:hypothetical protein